MAITVIDLTEASEGSVLLPEGAHQVKIKKVETALSKNSQKSMAKLTLQAKEGTLITNVMLEGPGAFKFIELAKALGLKGVEPGKKLKLDLAKLEGKVLGVVTSNDDSFNGELKTQVDKFITKGSVGEFKAEEKAEEAEEIVEADADDELETGNTDDADDELDFDLDLD